MKQRVTSLDVLRGFALLGILVMNIISFAMPNAAYFNPLAYGEGGSNRVLFVLAHVLVDQKFMALFSMLFGAGVILMTLKLESSGKRPFKNHVVRNAWLFAFGFLHGVFVWVGDILLVYALLAFPLYFLRNLPGRLLVIAGFCVYLIPACFNLVEQEAIGHYDLASRQTLADYWQPSPASIAADQALFRGGYSAQLAYRLGEGEHAENQGQELIEVSVLIDIFCRALGMMLIGMAFYRARVITGERSRKFYVRMLLWGLLIGLPLVIAGIVLSDQFSWNWQYGLLIGRIPNHLATPFIACAYLAGVMLWCQHSFWSGLRAKMAAVGRTAFTNYIAQSLIATTIFYGFGLGLYGHLSRWQLLIVVVIIWLAQLQASHWWLQRFTFGPLEWLWRSLTYFKLQPLIKSRQAH